MATFSTLESFVTLETSIPEWSDRLDDLNGQISLRQEELAQLEQQERPATRSLKPKGSTESLRPKESEKAFFSPDEEEPNPMESSTPLKTEKKQRPNSPIAARTPAASSNPLPNPKLQRNSSQPSHPTMQPRVDFSKIRKRKTESLASGESQAPKYRTRSMIIVYYDSAVQTAFEDLVKFVSGSRNAMRKGKMAAKMAEMRRAAELEVDDDDDEDDDEEEGEIGNTLTAYKKSSMLVAQKKVGKDDGSGAGEDGEFTMPKLKFVSTRQMGPSRDQIGGRSANMPSMGMLRGYRRSGQTGAPDIFDELDKSLEWCQSQCEHAAHQFLRDGDCSAEIESIKRRLAEIKELAGKEAARLRAEKDTTGSSPPQRPETKPRGLSSIKVRKELSSNMKDLEVDDGEMEVDEGIEDDDGPPTLVYKKARDYAR
ncbi:hypothetical protein BP6252_08378 [Coleophoma cylindrospora]|uniref:Uncharacterized protein n=1 Tax=Coleophoma cylindrospora TaxID=1849047 RepID=A0A3D8R5X3_9HELO|nr:hypothetical protein BP6252_08378 [Coleophoma cylindrospora]